MKSDFSDEQVVEAWRENALPWTEAVRGKTIESRNLVTDSAIVDAVMSRRPATVIDIGCGEGWLSRSLSDKGITCAGVDVVPELIERARALGGGEFEVASHEDIATGKIEGRYDVAVANFSLIGAEVVDSLVRRMPKLLNSRGAFIVQTMHPVIAGGDEPYVNGWRPGSWAGCGDKFGRAAPWYFRTIETWVKLMRDSGLGLVEIREPLHPVNKKPASIILIAECP